MSTTTEVRSVDVRGRRLRVSVRRGASGGTERVPLLLINGIGASLELLEPFVLALDPGLDVIRFDAPGVGGSGPAPMPYRVRRALIVAGDDDPLIPLVNARLMHRLIPRSSLHVYHGGHLGLVTEARELAPVIDDFLLADSD
jgi:pimeloyl-ACP methyl ester carboxylesterase